VKWFQVDSDTPDDPKIKAVIRRGLPAANGGQAAAGALLLLWCYVANHGGGEPGVGLNSDGQPLPLGEMADELLFDSQADLERFLDFLAEKRHIEPDRWATDKVVVLPAMAKRADAYARSKGRAKAGDVSPGRAKAGEKSPGLAPTYIQDTVPTVPTPPEPEGQLALTPPAPAAPKPEDLVEIWNKHRTKGPKVTGLNDSRRKAYAAALKLDPDLQSWAVVIAWLDGQDWCNARGTGSHANWRMDLDYLARPGTLLRAKERKAAEDVHPARGRATGRVIAERGKYAAAATGTDDDGDHADPTHR
jgi:hypothetical protein